MPIIGRRASQFKRSFSDARLRANTALGRRSHAHCCAVHQKNPRCSNAGGTRALRDSSGCLQLFSSAIPPLHGGTPAFSLAPGNVHSAGAGDSTPKDSTGPSEDEITNGKLSMYASVKGFRALLNDAPTPLAQSLKGSWTRHSHLRSRAAKSRWTSACSGPLAMAVSTGGRKKDQFMILSRPGNSKHGLSTVALATGLFAEGHGLGSSPASPLLL
mmetsp:Transcript_5372/g.13390  ORF Transcript_5372/g.13390 Transcript_5372/m.13390 type:complete len:215 (-) Transcript_5372:128-772(-)